MNLLPNYNLAGFLQKKLFAERRFVFVDVKKEKIDENLPVNEIGDIGETAALEEFKEVAVDIGRGAREAIDRNVDADGHIGLGGVSRTEIVAENAESLEDLLREADDYLSEEEGVEKTAKELDAILFKLLGGRDDSPARLHLTEGFNLYYQNVFKKYQALLEIREKLKFQDSASNAMQDYVQQYAEELEEEKQERIRIIQEERQSVLDKIAERIENKKRELDEQVNTFEAELEEPETLREYFEDGSNVGFFAHIRRKTNVEELLQKIREGRATNQEIEEMAQEIDYQMHRVTSQDEEGGESRLDSIKKMEELINDKNAQEELKVRMLNDVRGVLAFYREEGSLAESPQRIPQHPKEKEIYDTLILFEQTLQNPRVTPFDLIHIEEELPIITRPLKIIQENRHLLDPEIPEDKTAEEMQAELENRVQTFLNQPIPIHPKARKLFEKAKADVWTLDSEINETNFKRWLLREGKANQKGEITVGSEETEILRKKWLADKFLKLQKYEEIIQKANNSRSEKKALLRERRMLDSYFEKLKSGDPVEVVEELEAKGKVELVPETTFQREYKDTGITNSYFVIEQTEYLGDVAQYRQGETDWKIYMDDGFFQRVKNGKVSDNERDRCRARIAHELGHREFDAFKKKELEDAGIYENPLWDGLKEQFLTLVGDKKFSESGDVLEYSEESILNETWALYSEHQTVEIPFGNPYRIYIEKFQELLSSSKMKKTLYGAEGGTGDGEDVDVSDDITASDEGSEGGQEDTSGDSEKLFKARGTLGRAFKELEENLKTFGIDIGDARQEETGQEKPKKDQEAVLNIKKYKDEEGLLNGEKLLNEVVAKYPHYQPYLERLNELDKGTVDNLTNEINDFNKKFEKIENKLSGEKEKQGYFTKLWDDTRFLSADDIFHLVTESWEFAQRRRDRKSQDARAAFGQKLYGDTLLGNEYLSKQQKLEMDEVSEYQGNLKNMPDRQVYQLLFHPKNQDHFKAVISELCDRGLMRWDDPRIWDLFRKYTFVKIPNYKKATADNVYRNKWLRDIVMDIWDETTWDSWKKGNDGNLDSELGKLETETAEIINLGGGAVRDRLWSYLQDEEGKVSSFKKGEGDNFIMPNQRYHKLIDYAIKGGYLGMEDKFYFLIAGVHHRLLTVEQLQKIQGEGLGNIPILELFYGRNNTYPELDAMYERIGDNGGHPGGMHKMLMQEMANDPDLRTRFSKIISRKNISNIDHDDWHTMMMMMNSQDVDKMLIRTNGGDCQVTSDSVINGMTSFSTYVKAQKEVLNDANARGDQRRFNDVMSNIQQSLNSFVQYDGRIMQRVGDRSGKYWNINDAQRGKDMHGNGNKISNYQESMYRLISRIFELTEGEDGVAYVEEITKDIRDEDDDKKQKIRKDGLHNKVTSFDNRLKKIMSDPSGKGKEAVWQALKELADGMAGFADKEDNRKTIGKGFEYEFNVSWS